MKLFLQAIFNVVNYGADLYYVVIIKKRDISQMFFTSFELVSYLESPSKQSFSCLASLSRSSFLVLCPNSRSSFSKARNSVSSMSDVTRFVIGDFGLSPLRHEASLILLHASILLMKSSQRCCFPSLPKLPALPILAQLPREPIEL